MYLRIKLIEDLQKHIGLLKKNEVVINYYTAELISELFIKNKMVPDIKLILKLIILTVKLITDIFVKNEKNCY